MMSDASSFTNFICCAHLLAAVVCATAIAVGHRGVGVWAAPPATEVGLSICSATIFRSSECLGFPIPVSHSRRVEG